MRSRRTVQAENRSLRRRLDDCEALLAAAALAAGGSLIVSAASLDGVASAADSRILSLRLLLNGDMRVDFLAPAESDVAVTVLEEATC